jgi:hypothetical protein
MKDVTVSVTPYCPALIAMMKYYITGHLTFERSRSGGVEVPLNAHVF